MLKSAVEMVVEKERKEEWPRYQGKVAKLEKGNEKKDEVRIKMTINKKYIYCFESSIEANY